VGKVPEGLPADRLVGVSTPTSAPR
jgi:hypothetical protein